MLSICREADYVYLSILGAAKNASKCLLSMYFRRGFSNYNGPRHPIFTDFSTFNGGQLPFWAISRGYFMSVAERF